MFPGSLARSCVFHTVDLMPIPTAITLALPLLDGENSSSLPPQVRAASDPSVLFMGGRFRRGPDDPPDRGQLVGGDRLQPEPLQLGLPLGVAQRVHLLLQVAAQHVDAAVELHLVCKEGRRLM